MTLSVIIPAFNAETSLAAAIASIRSETTGALVVVVDDASTDNTATVASALADEYLRMPTNCGPAAARNAGIAATDADHIAFLDSDDVWTEGRLSPMREALASLGEGGVAIGATRFHVPPVHNPLGFPIEDGTIAVVPKFCSIVCDRQVFERVGQIDESLRNFEDYDWMLRAVDAGVPFITLSRPVTEYHQRPGSLSTAATGGAGVLFDVLHRAAKRRANPALAGAGSISSQTRAPVWGPVAGGAS